MRSLSTVGLSPLEQLGLVSAAILIVFAIWILLQAHWAAKHAEEESNRAAQPSRAFQFGDDKFAETTTGSHEHTPIEHTTRTTNGD